MWVVATCVRLFYALFVNTVKCYLNEALYIEIFLRHFMYKIFYDEPNYNYMFLNVH